MVIYWLNGRFRQIRAPVSLYGDGMSTVLIPVDVAGLWQTLSRFLADVGHSVETLGSMTDEVHCASEGEEE